MKTAEKLINQAIEQADFPSATLLAAKAGQPQYYRSFGKARLDSVYDLASLTKVLATTTVVMRLVDLKKLRVGDTVARHIPSLKNREIGSLRLSQLLTHTSGLIAWRPYYEALRQEPRGQRRKLLHQRLANETLLTAPGHETVYSDLGLLLLQWVIEKRTGTALDQLFIKLVSSPLSLGHMGFRPLWSDPTAPAETQDWHLIATETCPWRKRRLVGEVHDDNSFSLGGVTGHAGLFSSAHDIHLLCRELHAAYCGRRSIFSPKTVRLFWHWRQDGCHRALGWDRPAEQQKSAGRLFSHNSVGHLGFTGTSLWLDLDRGVWIIFLCNRVYRGREPNPMPKFRPKLHNAVMRKLLS